ncbi:MAG: DNA cytosine methyltransferase [Gammaproteobacteria bacterium]|nr:DNA cytosine methyltransferase [Gammaproteobacteria bacterium]
MTNPIPVIDLFSGPGGLAEGFAALKDSLGRPRFNIMLSIEMEPTAYSTLLLRSFLRKFPSGYPPEYYDFLNGPQAKEPDWTYLYPSEWESARDETRCLTLGTSESTSFIRQRIAEIRTTYGDRTVLLGGPPCQSYSVAGRARNVGNALYDPANDKRQSLYIEYADVLRQLQPAIAVMENVRGILSAKHDGRSVFSDVMDSLAQAGGKDRYHLFSLTSPFAGRSWGDGLSPKDFLVRAEEHGIPQTRHRVFVICIRCDIASTLPNDLLPTLYPSNASASVHDIIGAMPMLRSRLSRDDDDTSWQRVLNKAYNLALRHMPVMPSDMEQKFRLALDRALGSTIGTTLPFREAQGETSFPKTCPSVLRDWIFDPNLTRLPNNETRGHIDEDIARYLYAATYAHAFGRSPKACDFPRALAAKHRSWNTGKFDDRFRVQLRDWPSTTITSHISKDGHYFIHPDPAQCRSLTVREAARLQTFPDNYFFHGSRTQQYVQVGNAVPPYLAWQIAQQLWNILEHNPRTDGANESR